MNRIGFIGCGNMGSAIVKGLLEGGLYEARQIAVSCATQASAAALQERFGVSAGTDNLAVAACDIVVLAVKPQVLEGVVREVAGALEGKLVISIAAGKSLAWLAERLPTARIARLMPNTPAAVGQGMTAICYAEGCDLADRAAVERICDSFGASEVIPERLMDAASAVAGCSPAYVYMFIESMADAAVLEGMPRAQAYRFAAQAVLGSAAMVLQSGQHPAALKDAVCSPGGTTIEGLRVLEEGGMRAAVIGALCATVDKARRL